MLLLCKSTCDRRVVHLQCYDEKHNTDADTYPSFYLRSLRLPREARLFTRASRFCGSLGSGFLATVPVGQRLRGDTQINMSLLIIVRYLVLRAFGDL